MECPLCLWALPPPHCHGLLKFDGETLVCDRRGRGCGYIHPLGHRLGWPEEPPSAPDETNSRCPANDGAPAAVVDVRDDKLPRRAAAVPPRTNQDGATSG